MANQEPQMMRFTVVMAADGKSLLPTASLCAEVVWTLLLRGVSEYREGVLRPTHWGLYNIVKGPVI